MLPPPLGAGRGMMDPLISTQQVTLNRDDCAMLLKAITRCEKRGRDALDAGTSFVLQMHGDIEMLAQARSFITQLLNDG